MELKSKIYVAGHRGMVGSAIVRYLKKNGYTNIITRTREELDLSRQNEVEEFFGDVRPDFVFLAAAKVGGILANNTFPADFLYENLVIANNIIYNAWKYKVQKLINLGSSCIYPKVAKQPIKEEYLLTDTLEPTNEAYAIAKIAAIKLCRYFNEQYDTNFISIMPPNLYGMGDNFHYEYSHVLPAMIRKFHDAKLEQKDQVVLWGDGSPEREFLFVDDLAESLVFIMNNISPQQIGELVNVGFGSDIRIKELALLVREIVGFQGEIVWDKSRPNGTPKKLMDSSKINSLGWRATTSLREGINSLYSWFLNNYCNIKK